jgi:hypothetical protein
MVKFSRKTLANIVAVSAVSAFVVTPTMSIADASNPRATRMHKAKPKHHARHRIVRAKIMKPAPTQPAPIEAVQAAPEPMPEPAPAPQVVEAAPAPAPAPATAPAAPLAVAKKGGSGWLLGVLGAAAVVAGIVVLADNNKKPKSA